MGVHAEERRPATTLVELAPAADPAPLGLAAFALTTFMLSGHNASFIPDILWIGLALFYGGLIQLLAGMWEFRNRNVFGATAFSTYGGFWMSLFIFVVLISTGVVNLSPAAVDESLAWFLLAFFIFNTYMLLWSSMINWAVFAVFLTLEITEALLWVGLFALPGTTALDIVKAGGWAGIVTAGVAWYTSAALIANSLAGRVIVPVGAPFFGPNRVTPGRGLRPSTA
jgi:succinate-acetate transporter protein